MCPQHSWIESVPRFSPAKLPRTPQRYVNDARRTVRATRAFFDDLDAQLGSERGPNGEPSSSDFQVVELLPIIERFATDFDAFPEFIEGRPDYRVLVTAGVLVPRIAVTAQLAPDGAIELVALDIDTSAGWD